MDRGDPTLYYIIVNNTTIGVNSKITGVGNHHPSGHYVTNKKKFKKSSGRRGLKSLHLPSGYGGLTFSVCWDCKVLFTFLLL